MTQNPITVYWGDGFTQVESTLALPEELFHKLKYWHRSLEWDERQMRRVASGEYRDLYSLTGDLRDNIYVQQLITLPGFVHRIKEVLDELRLPFDFVDIRTPVPAPDLLTAMVGLREYQLECAYTALVSGGGIIACPTGWGKTHIIAALVKAYTRDELCIRNTPVTVVATPEKDITEKDYKDLCELLPDRDVGLVMSGRKKFSDDVQVCTLDSLHRLNLDEAGILIVDEAHTAPTPKRAEMILAANKALRWAVSATPTGRFDGRDVVTEGLFGPVVYHRTYAQGIADGALVPIRVLWVPSPEPAIGMEHYERYRTRAGKYRHAVDRNENQNRAIAQILKRLPADRQALCIMKHLDQMNRIVPLCADGIRFVHAEESQDALARKNLHNLAAVSRKERRAVYKAMAAGDIRQVLSTYVYKQGVNFPELTYVINAGGGGSELIAQQIPGSESRNIEGKNESYLIDFWHPWDLVADPNGGQKAGPVHKDDQSREKAYTKLGFEQIWLNSLDELPFWGASDGDNKLL